MIRLLPSRAASAQIKPVDTEQWRMWDREHCWHPFTRQAEWEEAEPLVLVSGEGVWLEDSEGGRYIDGNSSIWTNIHGHNHVRLNEAVTDQLGRVAHTSYLGFANPRASELAERLCDFFPEGELERVFFSDDGSTAVECAVKMAIQYRLQSGEPERTELLAFDQAYHGDTLGAASLGGVGVFFKAFEKFGFPVNQLGGLNDLLGLSEEKISKCAAVIIEPLVQGVNQINPWPEGMLKEIRKWCDTHGVHLILDEVMTGFGRTGKMFACQQEDVVPDFLCLAKGLTGGYMPLAATMVKGKIYDAFLGGVENAFYYGHSYTANQLGCAVALASLDVFQEEQTLDKLPEKVELMRRGLARLTEKYDVIHEVRQCGFIAGVELRQRDGVRFPPSNRIGEVVCVLAREYGLLTRPIQDTVVIMPPLSISHREIEHLCSALDSTLDNWTKRG